VASPRNPQEAAEDRLAAFQRPEGRPSDRPLGSPNGWCVYGGKRLSDTYQVSSRPRPLVRNRAGRFSDTLSDTIVKRVSVVRLRERPCATCCECRAPMQPRPRALRV